MPSTKDLEMLMRYPIPASMLAAAALLALPAGVSAQADATASLVRPLAACYSPEFPPTFSPASFGAAVDVDLNGPPNSTGWALRATAISRTPDAQQFSFDADGRASVRVFPVGIGGAGLTRIIGPAVPVRVTLRGPGDGGPEDPRQGPGILVGTTKALALGVQVVGKQFPPPGVSPRPRALVVAGVPFANTTLYGFIVEYKVSPATNPGNDPAERSRKVLRSIKLGKTDACGYLKSRAVGLFTPHRRGYQTQLYVNAGPKLDKPRSVHMPL